MPAGNRMGFGRGGFWAPRFWGCAGWGQPWAGYYPGGPFAYGWGFPPPGPGGYPYSAPQYSREAEVEFLKEQASYLESMLEDIRKRLKELEKEE